MRKTLCLAPALVALALCSSGTAAAVQLDAPAWDCRASAFSVPVSETNRLEPVVANGVSTSSADEGFAAGMCSDDDGGVPEFATPVGALRAEAAGAYARTRISPPTGPTVDQAPRASAGVEDLRISTADGTLDLRIAAVRTTTSASCASGSPALDGTSKVVGVTLGGRTIDVDDGEPRVLSLGPLGQVAFNERVVEDGSLVRRGVHVDFAGLEAVVAESSVSAEGAVCSRPTGQLCPDGSQLDPATDMCVIRLPGETIVVGSPAGAPSGGTVVPVSQLSVKGDARACLRGPGPRYAIVGTNGSDRITGTSRGDRILARGGRDLIAGGRGKDCIVGAGGRDLLNGSLGNDRLLGGAGKDALIGSTGTDRIRSAAGKDWVNTGYGADRVRAGAGDDAINAAVAGPAVHVDCGGGHRDRVRVNRNEARPMPGCERRFTIR